MVTVDCRYPIDSLLQMTFRWPWWLQMTLGYLTKRVPVLFRLIYMYTRTIWPPSTNWAC